VRIAGGGGPQPLTFDQDFHVVLAGQEPLEPVLQHGDVGDAPPPDIKPPIGPMVLIVFPSLARFLW
jgi:hypothetical protein